MDLPLAPITKAERRYRRALSATLVGEHITPSHWAVVEIVAESNTGIRASDIAKELGVKPPLVTLIVRKLIAQGIIQTVPSPFDGRAKMLAITPGGKRFIKQVTTRLSDLQTQIFRGVSQDDLQRYYQVNQRMIENIDRSEHY